MLLNKLKSFSIDSLYYGMSSVISKLVGFLLVPLFTQFLSPKDYGVMTLLGFYTLFFSPISHLGIQGAMFRFVGFSKSKQEEDIILSSAFKIVVIISFFFTLLSIIFIKPLELFLVNSNDYTILLLTTVIFSFFSSLNQMLYSYLRIKRKVKKIFYLNMVKVLISVSLSIFLVVFVGLGLSGVVYSLLFTSIFSFILLLVNVKISLFNKIDFKYIKQMFNYGLPNVPKYIQAIIMGLFGQYYIGKYLSIEDLGLYAVAWKFCLPIVVVNSAILNSWNAYKFDLHKKKSSKKVFSQFSNIFILIPCFVFLIISIWGGDLLIIFADQKFHSAAIYVPYLCLIPLFSSFYTTMSSYISFGENQSLNPYIGTTGLVVTVIASILLIPKLSIIGVAYATSLGWIAMSIFGYLYGQSIFKVNFQLSKNIILVFFVVFSALFLRNIINEYFILIINLPLFVIYLHKLKYINE